jgi:hypothetical protein
MKKRKKISVGEYVIVISNDDNGFLEIVVYDSIGEVIESITITNDDDEGGIFINQNLN